MKKIFLVVSILFLSFANAQDKNEITFKESPILLKINTDQIFGTLTTPNLTKKYPVALIIAGSDQQTEMAITQ